MKKIIKIFIIICVAGLISSCTTMQKGSQTPGKKIAYNQEHFDNNLQQAQMSANTSAQTKLLESIENGIQQLLKKDSQPTQSDSIVTFKKATKRDFIKKKIKTLKKYSSKNSSSELKKLKTRIALLEDQITKTGAGAVYFKSAKSDLSSKTKTWLEKNIVQPWFNGEIDITDINGYASKAKPKDSNINNMDYAKQRAIAVQHYLSYRGVQIKDIKININGPTARFGNNLNVTVVWDKIDRKTEQNKKKEERKQYIVSN